MRLEEALEEAPEAPVDAPTEYHPRHEHYVPRTAGTWFSRILGTLLLALGAGVLGAITIFPEQTELVTGRAVQVVREQVNRVQYGDTPSIKLGGEGWDIHDVDNAAYGEWILMRAYEVEPGLQPTYLAHNGSGGDLILPWELGQEVKVVLQDGTEQTMVVTDSRVISQWTSTTEDLLGLSGSILLQSCYYDQQTMRVVALTPAGEEATVPEQSGEGGGEQLGVPNR